MHGYNKGRRNTYWQNASLVANMHWWPVFTPWPFRPKGYCRCLHLSVHRPFVHGLFVSWGATGWRFVINSRANIHVTIDCSTVLPLVLGVATRQKPQINGSVVLGADESPRPCGTPSWYTPLSWMILSKQKNLHLFYHNTFCFFSKMSVNFTLSAR